ncbi:MAG: serine protease [Gammaproteobacteria bacterium]
MNPTLPSNMEAIAAIQEETESKLLDLPNVVGVAIGTKFEGEKDTGEPCLTALVAAKLDPAFLSKNELVPRKLKDVPTDVVEVGNIFAGDISPEGTPVLEHPESVASEDSTDYSGFEGSDALAATSVSLRRRRRPAMGGDSVGHFKITAGTIATCCYDLSPFPSMPGRYYILSNNHVLANSNNANIGDPILQPGPFDGGTYPRDLIARLTRYVPIRFHTATTRPLNYVDAAIAEGNFHDLNREVYWGGYVKDLYTAPSVGDIVQKTGRTTGFTTGKVTNINGTVDVNYGSGRVARFRNQIITTRMGAGGDSGSLVMNRDEAAVGLLFAGSSTRTIINNILLVQLLLKVRLHEK